MRQVGKLKVWMDSIEFSQLLAAIGQLISWKREVPY